LGAEIACRSFYLFKRIGRRKVLAGAVAIVLLCYKVDTSDLINLAEEIVG
jgi:hypothetical protein